MSDAITEIFALLAALPDTPKPLNALSGCYERDLPDGWRVSVNAHDDEHRDSAGRRVPAYHAFFSQADTLAMALVSPFGGTTVGPDTEADICDALRKAGAASEAL